MWVATGRTQDFYQLHVSVLKKKEKPSKTDLHYNVDRAKRRYTESEFLNILEQLNYDLRVSY